MSASWLSSTSPLRRAGRLLAAAGLAGVVALAVLEVGLRAYTRLVPNPGIEFQRYAHLMKPAAPGSGTSFRHPPGVQATLFGVEVTTDARGFRDRPGTDPSALQVVVLGDSVTFGWGVPYGDRFTEILERRWTKALGRPVELINTGHGNYNTPQQYALLRESFADERVDGVLQVWYVNDAEPTPVVRARPWYGGSHLAVFLWSTADVVARAYGDRGTFVDFYRDLYRPNAPGLVAFDAAMTGIADWTRTRRVPWILVLLPEFHHPAPGGPLQVVSQDVGREATELGAQVVDVAPAFADVEPASIWLARTDVHPNIRGHALIAAAIATTVDPGHFVPPAEGRP
jgi:lysophospholipase L1-like esterase